MKRSKRSTRAMRHKTMHTEGESKYARKRRSGRMMFGPGCGPGKRKRVE